MAAKRKKQALTGHELSDFGTPETRAHGEAVLFYSADKDYPARTIKLARVAGCSLDRLAFRKCITKRQFEAGNRYRADLHKAGMFPRMTGLMWANAGSTSPSTVQHISDQRISADQRLVAAKAAIGPTHTLVVGLLLSFDMMPYEVGFRLGATSDRTARRVGSTAVEEALTALADHYNLGDISDAVL